ncbi:BON domain-containing protein [Chitinimonas koreensis]|uniref:BON domain-containing protein n=1 Tax=Chitinimonas koreensis TaxID=356302 RepID=UPI000426C366|nr:BON domain-containing protein [Chitinimonas koreensis]QNM95159.1 BON domain-containing protein [Chitinimonas koreensis]
MQRSPLFPVLLAAALATLGLAGCDRRPADQPPPTTDTAPVAPTDVPTPMPSSDMPPADGSSAGAQIENAGEKAGQAIDDATVTTKVKAALAADAGLKTLKLDVDTKDGAVTVRGNVDSQTTADNVARVAQGVEGVKSVNSQLTVKP